MLIQNLPVGTQVLRSNNIRKDKKGAKDQTLWLGPFTIASQVKDGAYKLKNKDGVLLKRAYSGHQLKLYVPREEEEQEESDASPVFD